PRVRGLAADPVAVVLATLVVRAPALDRAPRGTGVLVAPDAQVACVSDTPGDRQVHAKALTHASAKWAWLAQAAGPGRHVLRLSYAPHLAPEDDRALRATAVRDASVLLGTDLGEDQVDGFARTVWSTGLSRARPGHGERVARLRQDVDQVTGLELCGAWVAGTGLAAVVADARAAARRISTQGVPDVTE
ncbi:hypothetical protein N869_09235, partial [Cellulomonas bogoriensis 69B4 = DSM 16987]